MEKRGRKGQEEIVGFVLIIVLVAVIGLVFLSLSIRRGEIETKDSKEIENFLSSSFLFTTSCYRSPEIIYNLKGLVKACDNNEKCLDGEETCKVLNETFYELIKKSWKISPSSSEKAYSLEIYKTDKIILRLSEGNHTSQKMKSEIPVYTTGENIEIMMEISY